MNKQTNSFLIAIIILASNLVYGFSLNSSNLNSLNSSPDYTSDSTVDDNKIRWPADLAKLNYTNLIKVEKDCKRSPDKCNYGVKRSRELDELDCFCDKDCKEFGNCCLDSNELNSMLNENLSDNELIKRLNEFVSLKEDYDCKELSKANSYVDLFVKSRCPTDFNVKLIRDKCEQKSTSNTQFESNSKDPYDTVPVTSTRSRITYSNIYCALCNEYKDNLIEEYSNLAKDNQSNLKFWKLNVTCDNITIQNLTINQDSSSFQDFLKNNFTLINDTWIMNYADKKNGRLKNASCYFLIEMPEDLQFYIKPCKHNLIDKCASNWPIVDSLENRKIQSLCGSYQSRVSYIDNQVSLTI